MKCLKEPAMSEFKGVCIDCGSPELYSNSEIRQPRMCVDCYAAMIGFARVGGSFVDSDTLGDDFPIENRISPNCKSRDV